MISLKWRLTGGGVCLGLLLAGCGGGASNPPSGQGVSPVATAVGVAPMDMMDGGSPAVRSVASAHGAAGAPAQPAATPAAAPAGSHEAESAPAPAASSSGGGSQSDYIAQMQARQNQSGTTTGVPAASGAHAGYGPTTTTTTSLPSAGHDGPTTSATPTTPPTAGHGGPTTGLPTATPGAGHGGPATNNTPRGAAEALGAAAAGYGAGQGGYTPPGAASGTGGYSGGNSPGQAAGAPGAAGNGQAPMTAQRGSQEYPVVMFFNMAKSGNYALAEDVISSKAKGLAASVRLGDLSDEKIETYKESFAAPKFLSRRNVSTGVQFTFDTKPGEQAVFVVVKDGANFVIKDLKIGSGNTKAR
jgi:hypothetical protein